MEKKENQKRNEIIYSFIIPCFREEKNIPLVYEKIIELMKKYNENFAKFKKNAKFSNNSYEIIFVNDGNFDNSERILINLAMKDSKVKFITLSRNFGQQVAISAGLDNCSGKAIITLDCDLQDPPEIIEKMIAKWKQGNDIVYARRINRHDKFFKKITAIIYYIILDKFSSVKIPRNVGDFRLIDRKVLNYLKLMNEKSRYLRGMVAWLGFKYDFVDFDRPERLHGETGYTYKKMIKLAFDGILNFSMFPLKIGLYLGVISIFLGILMLLYTIFDIIINQSVYPLYKWLVIIILMFVGFQFILTWILGEYIGRVYEESKNRPLYVIDSKQGFE
jgi:dolichol-phosphate mannosyltransferase